MATYTFDPSDEGVSAAQQQAEAAALEVGEKIVAQQQAEKEARLHQEVAPDNLIAGKFKSQEDLLRAYEELQKKLGQDTPEEGEEPAEEPTEATEEAPTEEEISPAEDVIVKASKSYEETGELSEEAIEELAALDSKELIKAYLSQFQKQTAAAKSQTTAKAESDAIIQSVGGAEKYGEMIQWAAQNMSPDEITAYNTATNAGAAAARFAVEALSNRYRAAEGYEAPLVRGKATTSSEGFRSNAELSRAIADPRYHSDPAYRMDVEAKLARSGNLL